MMTTTKMDPLVWRPGQQSPRQVTEWDFFAPDLLAIAYNTTGSSDECSIEDEIYKDYCLYLVMKKVVFESRLRFMRSRLLSVEVTVCIV